MSKKFWSIGALLLVIMLATSIGLAACSKPAPSPTPSPKPSPAPTSTPTPTTTATPKPTPTSTPTPTPTAKPAPIELVFGSFAADTHAQSGPPFKEFAKRIEERTKGAVKFRTVWGGALLGGNDHLEGLSKGIADMTYIFPPYFPGQLRFEGLLTNVLDLDLGPKLDMKGITLIHNALYNEVPELRGDYERLKIKVLFQLPPVNYGVVMKSPVTGLKDLKGKKIRAFGKYLPIMIEGAGATPVTVAGPEIYSALQTGLVDGALSDPDYLGTIKVPEVAPYLLSFKTVPIMATGNIAINMNSWNKLSPDIQQIFEQTSKEMLLWTADYVQKMSDGAVDKYAKLSGKPAGYFSAADLATWQKAAPLLDMSGKDLDALGLPGTKTVTRWRQLANDYVAGKWPAK